MSMLAPLRRQPASGQLRWLGTQSRMFADHAVIFALALALRLYHLGANPLWIDEVVTRQRAALPGRQLVADSLVHHHLPTYFLLLAQLSPGADAWLLRLPSAIGGAVAAALAVAIGRTLAAGTGAARPAGLISGLLLATAPVMVQFSQDARPYGLELACLLLSLWGLVSLACHAEAASGSWRAGRGAWAALVLGMAGALALIGNAVPFVLVANISAWAIARGLPGLARRRFLLRWIVGQALVLLVAGPLYLAMVHSVDDRLMAAFNWIPPLSAVRAWRVAADVYLLRSANIVSLRLIPGSLAVLGLLLPLLAGASFFALRRQPAARIAMLLAVVLLPVSLVLSEPARPLWLPRYLLWSGAAWLILAGTGAAWLARRAPLAAPLAAAALLLLNLLPFYRAETVPRWDLAAAALAPTLAGGADLYMDDHGIPMMLRAYLPGGEDSLPRSRVLYQLGKAQDRLRAGTPVIAVHGPTGQALTSPIASFRAGLEQLGTPSEQMTIGQEIVLMRFDPVPLGAPPHADSDARPAP